MGAFSLIVVINLLNRFNNEFLFRECEMDKRQKYV